MRTLELSSISSRLSSSARVSRKAVVKLFQESIAAWVVLIALGLTMLLVVIGNSLFDFSTRTTVLSSLMLAVLAAFGVGSYLSALDRQFGIRSVKYDWQVEVEPQVSNVSPRTWSRFQWMLLPENPATGRPRESKVIRATRQHVIILFQAVLPALMLWLLMLFLVVGLPWLLEFLQPYLPQTPQYAQYYRGYVPWWIMLIVTPLALLAAWLLSFDWRYKLYVITNLGLRVMKVPPIWMPWVDVQNSNFFYDLLRLSNPKPAGVIGNMLGYGSVKTGTYLDNSEDEEIREMHHLPDFHDFSNDLEVHLPHGHAVDPMA